MTYDPIDYARFLLSDQCVFSNDLDKRLARDYISVREDLDIEAESSQTLSDEFDALYTKYLDAWSIINAARKFVSDRIEWPGDYPERWLELEEILGIKNNG